MKNYIAPEITVMKIATDNIILVSGNFAQPKTDVGGVTAQSTGTIDANVFDEK